MQNPALVTVAFIALFVFTVFNVVSRIFYKKRHKTTYHFYQMFPYEFNYPAIFKENPYGNFLFLFSGFAVCAFYILNPYDSIYKVFSLIIAIVFTMIILCLTMMPMTYLRTHIFLACVSMGLAMALPLFNFFLAFNQYRIETDQLKRALCIASLAISALLALTMMTLILNPKLTFKIYYRKEIGLNGKEVLKRPPVIFLAMTEWMAIYTYFLSIIPVTLICLL